MMKEAQALDRKIVVMVTEALARAVDRHSQDRMQSMSVWVRQALADKLAAEGDPLGRPMVSRMIHRETVSA